MKNLIDSIKYFCNYRFQVKFNLIKPTIPIIPTSKLSSVIDPLVLKICDKLGNGEFKRCSDVGFDETTSTVEINGEIVSMTLSSYATNSIYIVIRSIGEVYEIDKCSTRYLYSKALEVNLFGVWINKSVKENLYKETVTKILT